MKRLTPFFISIRNNLFALLLFLVIWWGCAWFFPPYILPSPVTVFGNLTSCLHADFFRHLVVSFYRVLAGFLIAFFIGTGLGILAAGLKKSSCLNTLMVLFQVIPGIILGIIFLLIFGIGHCVPIALVAFLTLPLVSINTSNALEKKHPGLEQYLRSIGGRRSHLIKNIYLPLLIPTIQSNLTLGFSLSLKVVVLGEFIGSQDGIGYVLHLSKIYFNMADVFFYLFVILLLMVSFQIVENVFFTTFLRRYFYPE